MKVIVPCCGRSTRYPDMPPKWMLPAPDGRPMVCYAVEGLEVDLDDVVIVILTEHDERYDASAGINAAFGRAMNVVSLPTPTRSQSETVAQALARLNLAEPFLVKDSDSSFHLGDLSQDANYVACEALGSFDLVNARNKSYLQSDRNGLLCNIKEKEVISELFSVGGYYFTEPDLFLEHHKLLEQAKVTGEIYISDVIGSMLLEGVPFTTRKVSDYRDWGTIHEWRRRLLDERAYFVSLDGFVFERGSSYFAPLFESVKPRHEVIEALREVVSRGREVVYLSIRPSALADLTQRQLADSGAPAGRVLFDCPATNWTVLTAPHSTLPFRTSDAMELSVDDPNLVEKLLGE